MKQIKTAEEILEGIAPYSIQGYPLLYDAVDVRNAMQIVYEQLKPEWTAVEDGLPEESGWYMTAYGKTVKSSYYCNRNKKFYSVYTPTDGYWRKSVTHWQPLPSLPNQKQ